jgi:dinuclear metal center YbgI/SA1388 family protein
MISRKKLVEFLNEYLKIGEVKDHSCNGLQIQGAGAIDRVGFAVDGCMEAYKKAAKARCQMLIVHHGIIWNNWTSVTGPHYEHTKFLVEHGINLYASHLPLDLHPEAGNNIVIARLLELVDIVPFGDYHGASIGYGGKLPEKLTNDKLAQRLKRLFGREVVCLPFGKKTNGTVAIISGGGSDCMQEAIDKGFDCFITGEGAHWNHHTALEGKINVMYCGHYETETVGVRTLMKIVEKKFPVKTIFLDVPTMV